MQDNKSCMLLQKNGQFSVGKGSKHIHIRYFFAMDKINKREIKLIYCSTGKMIADFSTKPLQGAIFVEFRNKMQGIESEDFEKYKRQYVEILKQYHLYENEDDLFIVHATTNHRSVLEYKIWGNSRLYLNYVTHSNHDVV